MGTTPQSKGRMCGQAMELFVWALELSWRLGRCAQIRSQTLGCFVWVLELGRCLGGFVQMR